MRQHILRLLIVLVIAVGIGIVVYFAVRDNTPFLVSNYIQTNIQEDKELKDNLNELSSKVNAKYNEDVAIYGIGENNSKYYASALINVVLTKEEANVVRAVYKEYRNDVKQLITSTNSLISYLNETNPNSLELEGRKDKVNTDFNEVNKSLYKVNVFLESLVNSKIYAGENFNVNFTLKSTLNILINAYNKTRNNFSLIDSVNTKIVALETNNSNSSSEAVKFVVKFNQMGRQEIENTFVSYFTNGVASDDLNILLNFLNSEVYYEEV